MGLASKAKELYGKLTMDERYADRPLGTKESPKPKKKKEKKKEKKADKPRLLNKNARRMLDKID